MLVTTIFGRSAEFLVGAAFALLPARARGQRATWGGGLLLVLVVGLLVSLQLHTGQVSIDTALGVTLNNGLLPLATGSLLYGLATEASRLQRLLGSGPMQVLGQASYCFYLLHMGFVHNYLEAWLAPLPAGLGYALILALTGVVAVGAFYLIERPVHRWLLRRGQAQATPPQPIFPT